MDLQIREFQNAIINFVNGSDLPIEVKRLCIAEIVQNLGVSAKEAIKVQIYEREQKESAESEEKQDAENV